MEKQSTITFRKFETIASNPSNYVGVLEESSNLQTLYNLRDRYINLVTRNRQKYNDLLEDYNSIIKTTATFIKELGLSNNSASYYAIFSYLLWNGYLSKNMNFVPGTKELLDIHGFQGLDIIKGKGVCRTITSLQKEVFNALGYDCYLLVNVSEVNLLTYIMDIEKTTEEGLKILYPLFTYINTNLISKKSIGNHMSLLLRENKNYYIYDATNSFVYKLVSPLLGELYNGVGNCYTKPWSFIYYEGMNQEELLKILSSIEKQDKDAFISDTEIFLSLAETINICKKNKKLILDFHHQIKNNIDNIDTKI